MRSTARRVASGVDEMKRKEVSQIGEENHVCKVRNVANTSDGGAAGEQIPNIIQRRAPIGSETLMTLNIEFASYKLPTRLSK